MAFWQAPCVLLFLALGLAHGADPDLGCPPMWTHYGYYCYRFFGPLKTWQSAEEHCREFFTRKGQGHLASIHNSGENALLLRMWKTSLIPSEEFFGSHVWIGISDQETEGSFRWSDGTSRGYDAWLGGQPDNAGNSGEDCGAFWQDGSRVGWNDDRCDIALPYLCKMYIG